MKAFGNPAVFVVAYLIGMIPTYVLPYFGSNSAFLGAISAAMGMGPTPQWWVHAWFLTALAAITWVRSGYAGRTYLSVFPVVAAAFDLAPGLSMIPLVPTVMHVFNIVLGVKVKESAPLEILAITQKKATRLMIIATAIAIAGMVLFFTSKVFRSSPTTAVKKEELSQVAKPAPAYIPAPQPSVMHKEPEPALPSPAPKPVDLPPPVPVTKAELDVQKPSPALAVAPAAGVKTIAETQKVEASQPARQVAIPKKPAHTSDNSELARDKARLKGANSKLDDLLKN